MPYPGPVTDSHVHLWDPARFRYPWLASVPALAHAHDLPAYTASLAGFPVTRRVFVQCECDPAQARDEALWAAGQPEIHAVVAYAPLELGLACHPDLTALSHNPKIVGVRRNLQGEPDPAFCLRPDFVAGVRALAAHRFTFDLCLLPAQLPAATELARLCPEVTFILDHLGKPALRTGLLDPWRDDIRAFSALPNVFAKVSGLATETGSPGWTYPDLQPCLDHAVACFGWSRLLFGSDWPVVNLAGGVGRWLDAISTFTASATPAERLGFFHHNANRAYRLPA